MISIFRKLLRLLSPHEKRRAAVLLVMIVVMGLLDMGGVASIVPFMSVLGTPELIETNAYLAWIYNSSGIRDTNQFLFALGLVVLAAFVASIAFQALTTYAIVRFTSMRSFSISSRMVSGYLYQPYEWFLSRHSADLGKSVLSEVDQVIRGAMMPMANLIAHGTAAFCLLALLVIANPILAMFVGLVIGGAYAGVYLFLRPRLRKIGKERVANNMLKYKIIAEAFGGIKEIKVAGLEKTFCQHYKRPAKEFATAEATGVLTKQMPRFLLEAIAFGGMLAVVLYLMRTTGSIERALPTISLYAVAGYRMLPAMQHAYTGFAALRFAEAAVDHLCDDLDQIETNGRLSATTDGDCERIKPKIAIKLKSVTYKYPNATKSALTDIDIEIPAFQTIGIVGSTGSGKTTTVDIVLGLLQPTSGNLFIDDVPLTLENLRNWQRSLGYVPQTIYLADDSVAANIAFGVPREKIDLKAIERAAKIANLHDFVVGELPAGYDTEIGERGVRLSGGQRQRIGIARALYHSPSVLILDEATSALDSVTEYAVMEAVNNLSHQVTLILIAHRLTTVRSCDCIYMLEQGRLVGQGDYDELVASNERFRSMAGIN